MSNKYPNNEINNNNINNNNNMNIVEKVDAYWQNEYEIPSLMEMLERRQNLLASMRVESWENDIKPLEIVINLNFYHFHVVYDSLCQELNTL